MYTALERIRAKIVELEAKIADLRIAEREIQALEKLPARKTRPAPGPKPKPKPKRKPEASNQAEARRTIGSQVGAAVGRLSASSLVMEILMACGRRFVLLAFKSKNRCASGRERVEEPRDIRRENQVFSRQRRQKLVFLREGSGALTTAAGSS
ncbi:MAG: hypothetical protein WA231_02010 [Methylocella sp.]